MVFYITAGNLNKTEPLAPHYKSYGAFPGHARLRSCIMLTSALKLKWQVPRVLSISISFYSLKGFIKKNWMLFNRHGSLPSKFVKVLNKALGIVFETKRLEINLAKGNEKQLNFCMNAWLIEPVLLSAAVEVSLGDIYQTTMPPPPLDIDLKEITESWPMAPFK